MAALRVVLDTNVLLSGIAYPASVPGRILSAWRHGALELLLSDFILQELARVLPRLVQRHGLSAGEIADLVEVLAIQAESLSPESPDEPALRNAADLPVLGTLIAARSAPGGVDYLVTGDKDLLALAGRYPIVSPAVFWAAHGGL